MISFESLSTTKLTVTAVIPVVGYFLNQAAEDVHFPSAWHPMTVRQMTPVCCHQGTDL